MAKPPNSEVRLRDDRNLRAAVSEFRSRMKAEGVEEQPLDWVRVAAEERALWWRERVRQALTGLSAQAGEWAVEVQEALLKLARAPETLADAALEIVLDAVRGVGRLSLEPARACVLPGAAMELEYSSPADRAQRGIAGQGAESMGVMLSAGLPTGVRVVADGKRMSITAEFWKAGPLAMLIPQDPAEPVRIARVAGPSVEFLDLPAGEYLLFVQSLKE